MSTVTLRYWAAAKQAAGVAEETISAETLAAALEAALSARERNAAPGADADLRAVLARSSFLVNGSPGRRAARPRPWRCGRRRWWKCCPRSREDECAPIGRAGQSGAAGQSVKPGPS